MDWIFVRVVLRWTAFSLCLGFLLEQLKLDFVPVLLLSWLAGGPLTLWWEEREIDDRVVKGISALKEKYREWRRNWQPARSGLTPAERRGRYLDFTLRKGRDKKPGDLAERKWKRQFSPGGSGEKESGGRLERMEIVADGTPQTCPKCVPLFRRLRQKELQLADKR